MTATTTVDNGYLSASWFKSAVRKVQQWVSSDTAPKPLDPNVAPPVVPPSPTPVVPPPPPTPVVKAVLVWKWQWKDVGGIWKAYDDSSVCAELEVQCHVAKEERLVIIAFRAPNGFRYEVDVDRMKQRNTSTNYERDVRRIPWNITKNLEAQPAMMDSMKFDPTVSAVLLWQWRENDGSWKTYDFRLCSKMEAAWSKKGRLPSGKKVSVQAGGVLYEVDVASMKQRNVRTGFQREVRRWGHVQAPLPGMSQVVNGVPNRWTVWSDDHSTQEERVVVDPASQEYRDVLSKVTERTARAMKDLVVERIQHRDLWDMYSLKKSQLTKCNEVGPPEERYLFHGTSGEGIVDGILTYCFDFRTCGRNATVYGKGSYFAVNASYSLDYSDLNAATGDKGYIFMAKVLVGRYTKGASDLTRPPPLDPAEPNKLLHDSCVNSETSPSMFVTFDRAQAYPEYLLTYTVEKSR